MNNSYQYERRTTHAGHLYINGVHWLYRCPLCLALLERADAVAAEQPEDHHDQA